MSDDEALVTSKLKEFLGNPFPPEEDEEAILQHILESMNSFYTLCPEKQARALTMICIIKIAAKYSSMENANDDIALKITKKILDCYQEFTSHEKNRKKLKGIIYAEVDDELWKQCFLEIVKLDVEKCHDAADLLLHIQKPENKIREAIIKNRVKEMLDVREDFSKGLSWINVFNLVLLKTEEIKTIIFRSHIYNLTSNLHSCLKTKKFNKDYLKLLDECYKRNLDGLPAANELEAEFLQAITSESLPQLMRSEAYELDVDIKTSEFHLHYITVIHDIRHKFVNDERTVFEEFALNTLRLYKNFNRTEFVNFLIDDPKYAYCWSKFLSLTGDAIPEFVQQLGHKHASDAKKFIQSIKDKFVVPSDSVGTCEVLGKKYKFIMITTPAGLENFVHTYFGATKPKVLGIDCEAYHSKLALLQLATKNWVAIIDVFLISRHTISSSDWIFFFKNIFDPSITRIGFAFTADYCFIKNAFPFLRDILEAKKRKVFCLVALLKSLPADSEANNVIFPTPLDIPSARLGLSNVSKIVLGIKIPKDQQCSDWQWRPLTEEQKIYAVTDAVIVIKIKEKIEADLVSALGVERTSKIMENGYICYEKKPPKELKSQNMPKSEDVPKPPKVPKSENGAAKKVPKAGNAPKSQKAPKAGKKSNKNSVINEKLDALKI